MKLQEACSLRKDKKMYPIANYDNNVLAMPILTSQKSHLTECKARNFFSVIYLLNKENPDSTDVIHTTKKTLKITERNIL